MRVYGMIYYVLTCYAMCWPKWSAWQRQRDCVAVLVCKSSSSPEHHVPTGEAPTSNGDQVCRTSWKLLDELLLIELDVHNLKLWRYLHSKEVQRSHRHTVA